MKVLWVTNALGCGGAERQMLYMYDIINRYCDFDVSILYYARVGDELNLDGVDCHYIDKNKEGKLKTIRKIRKFIRDNDIQIVHAFGGSSANLYGRMGALFTKAVPVGAMLGKRHFVRKPFAMINSFLNMFGNWWTVNNTDLIPILKKDLKFVNEDRVRLLHNGFLSAQEVSYARDEHTEYDEDKKDRFVFAVVGRLQRVKNYPLFIKAARNIVDRHAHVRFWIIGNGDEYDSLQDLVKENDLSDFVKFWGYRTDIDVALDRADVFVQTSFTEGSPNSVAEAMRAKKPIISTRSTNMDEMIIEGKNGYVIPVDDLDALTSAMEKMLNASCEERKMMGQVSERLFEETFLDQKVAAEFQSFYTEVLKER